MMAFIASLLAALVSGYQLNRMVTADHKANLSDEELAAQAFEANEVRRKASIERLALEKRSRLGFMLTHNLYNKGETNGKETRPKQNEGWSYKS